MNIDNRFDFEEINPCSPNLDSATFDNLWAQYKRAVYTRWVSVIMAEPWPDLNLSRPDNTGNTQ